MPVLGTVTQKGRKRKDKMSHQSQAIKSSQVNSISFQGLGKVLRGIRRCTPCLQLCPLSGPSFSCICKWIELTICFLSVEFCESESFFSSLCPFQYKLVMFLLIFSKILSFYICYEICPIRQDVLNSYFQNNSIAFLVSTEMARGIYEAREQSLQRALHMMEYHSL